jgi:hypothetical protein
MNKLINTVIITSLFAVGCHTQMRGLEPGPFRSVHLSAGSHPNVVTVSDINQDRNPDILVANGESANFSVYLGDGRAALSKRLVHLSPPVQNRMTSLSRISTATEIPM